MKLAIIISTGDIEAAWSAFRFANFSKKEGDEVTVFLMGKAVDYAENSTEQFPSKSEAEKFLAAGGAIRACGTCLKMRNKQGGALCPISGMKDLHALVKEADKTVCF